MTFRRTVPAALAAALVVASCGSDSDVADDVDDVADTLPDADALIEDAEELGISPLALALDQTASASAFRMEMAIGMSMDMGFGESMEFAADPANPVMLAEQDAEGEQRMSMDMASMIDAMGAGGVLGEDIGMEMWIDGDTMYADYGSLGTMLAAGGVEIPEGVFTVDLAALADAAGEALGGADVASSLTGQAMPDPVEMATVLKDVLGDATGDGSVHAGTIGFLDYSRAMGQDTSALTGALGDLDGLIDADALLGIYEDLTVDVQVTILDGAADVISFDIDMTPMFAGMAEAFGDDVGGGADLFADASMSMEMVMDYDIDPTVDVQIPAGDFPDATDDLLQLLSVGSPLLG